MTSAAEAAEAIDAKSATGAPGAGATDLSAILAWYTGRALARVQELLPRLAEAEIAGFWPPKLSRSARAILSKQSVAERFARRNERPENHRPSDADEGLLEFVGDVRGRRAHEAKLRGWRLVHAMRFGAFEDAAALVELAERLAPHTRGDAERTALATALGWARDFAPVARLFARLDATRPRPSYEFGEISAAVRANVQDAMGLQFETVRAPEVEWREVEIEKNGKKARIWLGFILWPEGTRHGASKFDVGPSGVDQCQACGHAIHRGDNWVPLVLDGPRGPASLWVGRDCARHLFGCRVSGEGEFSNRRVEARP